MSKEKPVTYPSLAWARIRNFDDMQALYKSRGCTDEWITKERIKLIEKADKIQKEFDAKYGKYMIE